MKPKAFLTVAFACLLAGCVESIDPAEAPDGRDSLLVGRDHFGQYVLTRSQWNGHTIEIVEARFADDGELVLRTAAVETNGSSRFESWIGEAGQVRDAFGNLRNATLLSSRSLDANRTPSVELPPRVRTVAVAVDSRKPLFVDEEKRVRQTINDVTTQWSAFTRTYSRDGEGDEQGFASLAGRVLHLGERIEFSRDYSRGDIDYRSFVNYTVLRSERVDGVRAFVVATESAHTILRMPEGTTILNLEDAPKPGEKVPATKNYAWYTSTSPVPVKREHSNPFKLHGQWYWQNSTVQLENIQRTGPVIPWGQPETTTFARPLEAARRVDARNYLAAGESSPLTYRSENAWRAVTEDPLLTEFQTFLLEHPAAWPTSAYYVPDPGNNTYTWTFGVHDDSGFPVAVSSHLTFPVAGGPGIVTNQQEDWRDLWFDWPSRPWADEVPGPLPTIAEAYRSVEDQLWGEEPAVAFGYHQLGDTFGESMALLDFVRSSELRAGENLRFMRPARSVTLDLADGGLRTINWTFVHAHAYDPGWYPTPSGPVGLPFADTTEAIPPGLMRQIVVPTRDR